MDKENATLDVVPLDDPKVCLHLLMTKGLRLTHLDSEGSHDESGQGKCGIQ
jgi:hypothetical protein